MKYRDHLISHGACAKRSDKIRDKPLPDLPDHVVAEREPLYICWAPKSEFSRIPSNGESAILHGYAYHCECGHEARAGKHETEYGYHDEAEPHRIRLPFVGTCEEGVDTDCQ